MRLRPSITRFNTIIASFALVVLFLIWPWLQRVNDLSRMNKSVEAITTYADRCTPMMPKHRRDSTRFGVNLTYSWPRSALVVDPTYRTWQEATLDTRFGFIQTHMYMLPHLFLSFCAVWCFDAICVRSLRPRVGLFRVAIIAFVSLPIIPVAMAIGFGAQVWWARLDWNVHWQPYVNAQPEQLAANVSDQTLWMVMLSATTAYVAMLLLLTSFLASRTFSRRISRVDMRTRCPKCSYELTRDSSACPECGTNASPTQRVRQHLARAKRNCRWSAVVLAVATIGLMLSPLWMP